MKFETLKPLKLAFQMVLISIPALAYLAHGQALPPDQKIDLSLKSMSDNRELGTSRFNMQLSTANGTASLKAIADIESSLSKIGGRKGPGFTSGLGVESSSWAFSLLKKDKQVEPNISVWNTYLELSNYYKKYFDRQLALPPAAREVDDGRVKNKEFIYFLSGSEGDIQRLVRCILSAPNVLPRIPGLGVKAIPNFVINEMKYFPSNSVYSCDHRFDSSLLSFMDNTLAPKGEEILLQKGNDSLEFSSHLRDGSYLSTFEFSSSLCLQDNSLGGYLKAWEDDHPVIDPALGMRGVPQDFRDLVNAGFIQPFDASTTNAFTLVNECNAFVASHILSRMDEILDWYLKNLYTIEPDVHNKFQSDFITLLKRAQKPENFITEQDIKNEIKEALSTYASLANGFTTAVFDNRSFNLSEYMRYNNQFSSEVNPETQILSLFVGNTIKTGEWGKEILDQQGDLKMHLKLLIKALTQTCDQEFFTDYRDCLSAGRISLSMRKNILTLRATLEDEPLFIKYRFITE